jgi:hypothetical protein
VATDSQEEELVAEISRAKEAYLLVLRRAFVSGLDPRVLVQNRIMSWEYSRQTVAQPIDLRDTVDLRESPQRVEVPSVDTCRDVPIAQFFG